jgi:hypothetical protein
LLTLARLLCRAISFGGSPSLATEAIARHILAA